MGVLAPAQVDPDSGYRRYTESQLATARLVAGFASLGLQEKGYDIAFLVDVSVNG